MWYNRNVKKPDKQTLNKSNITKCIRILSRRSQSFNDSTIIYDEKDLGSLYFALPDTHCSLNIKELYYENQETIKTDIL